VLVPVRGVQTAASEPATGTGRNGTPALPSAECRLVPRPDRREASSEGDRAGLARFPLASWGDARRPYRPIGPHATSAGGLCAAA
jgi:hypothetical protein